MKRKDKGPPPRLRVLGENEISDEIALISDRNLPYRRVCKSNTGKGTQVQLKPKDKDMM